MRRLGDYDVWLTTTYRLKFVELRRNSVENVPELILVFFFVFFLFFYYYYYLQSKSTVAGGIDYLVILYLHASSDCLESRMLFFFKRATDFNFFTSASCRLGSGTTHDPHSGRHVVYLSKTYFLSKSTGNTREAVSRTT